MMAICRQSCGQSGCIQGSVMHRVVDGATSSVSALDTTVRTSTYETQVSFSVCCGRAVPLLASYNTAALLYGEQPLPAGCRASDPDVSASRKASRVWRIMSWMGWLQASRWYHRLRLSS